MMYILIGMVLGVGIMLLIDWYAEKHTPKPRADVINAPQMITLQYARLCGNCDTVYDGAHRTPCPRCTSSQWLPVSRVVSPPMFTMVGVGDMTRAGSN